MKLYLRLYICVSVAALAACSDDVTLPPVAPAVEASFLETSTSPTPLTPLMQLGIPTYDGSGQSVHPDVVRFRGAWNGWEYWMSMTPFPLGHEAFENPSILVSHDGLRWQIPAGVTNPLAKTPGKRGYNSDADLSYDASGDQLVMVYREVTATHNLIRSTTSHDGVHWSRPVLVFRRPNHDMVSPAVTFTASGTPVTWYVDAGPKNCAERVSHVSMQTAASAAALSPAVAERGWSTPKYNVLVQAGMNIWHIDATWVPERNEFWAAYVAYPIHHCQGQDLYFARSADGVKWTTYSIPFLRHDATPWTAGTLYRSSVMYDASRDVIQFFVSGQAVDKTWHVGYVDYSLKSFLSSLENGFPVLVASTSRTTDPGPIPEP